MNRSAVEYEPVGSAQATFKDGLTCAAHRWFRLTPSFGPTLVRIMLDRLGADQGATVLDPFSGAGTTSIECQALGLRSYGFEINPFLKFASSTALRWSLNCSDLVKDLARIRESFMMTRNGGARAVSRIVNQEMPKIHNVERWWRHDVLTDLLCLKHTLKALELSEAHRDFFTLSLAGVLVPDLTNVALNRLQLHFIDKSAALIDTWESFSKHANEMILDLDKLSGCDSTSTIYHGDATSQLSQLPEKASHVITSPPYPNRYSYVWNTRPHLYFFDFMDAASEAAALDCSTIGGTWGVATSRHSKGVLPSLNRQVELVVSPVSASIRDMDNLMANYLTLYFNDLARHILQLREVLLPGSRLAYVIGCSRLKGVFVETDVMLAQLFESLDERFKVDSVTRIRRRNSGKNLHESVVYLTFS